jgi:hypothetical protein
VTRSSRWELLLASRAVIDVEVTERQAVLRPAEASRVAGVASVLRRHWPLLLLLAAGLALRILALIAVYPGIWFTDSNGFIITAATGTLSTIRVSGYALFVAPFLHAGSAGALIIAQHLIGLAIVVLLYALLRRRGVSRLVAVLAVVPAALDAYLIQVEHTIMSETIFHAALVSAFAALLWKDRPGLAAAAASGLLLGYAGVVRSVAFPLIAVFLLYVLMRRLGWRHLVALAVGWVLVTGGYAAIYDMQHGKLGFTDSGGRFLYGEVAPFIDCSRLPDLPRNERVLCPPRGIPQTPTTAMWSAKSPILELPPGSDAVVRDFARRVLRDQPLTYARIAARDFLHYFEPGHRTGPNDPVVGPWQFPADPNHWGMPGYRGPIRPADGDPHGPKPPINPMVGKPHTNVTASRFLHDYQRWVFLTGPAFAACLLIVLAAFVLRRGAWRLRLDAAFIAAAVVASLVVVVAVSMFSYRYGLTAVLLMPVAAALAASALLQPKNPSPTAS